MGISVRKWVASVGAVLGAVIVFVAPAWAQARSERIGDVRIDAELSADGALHVVEERPFVYWGSFQGAFYRLPLDRGQTVELHAVRDASGLEYRPGTCEPDGTKIPGEYEVTSDGAFEVIWCWDPPPTDTTRTIILDYTVQGAGTRHADAAQLYWQWVGTGWDVPSASVVADVRLPASGDELEFWAHGPLWGRVGQTEPGLVRTQVNDLPASTFVELRVLMPADALAAAPSDGREVRPAIREEEACLATAADADRARARGETPQEDCDPQAGRKRWYTGLLAVGLLGGTGAWWQVFRRHGREHPLPDELPDYERELPSDDPPAFIDGLLRWGTVGDKALVATILDLARRGHLRIRRELVTKDRLLLPDKAEQVTIFERVSMPERPWEAAVVRLLFSRAAGGESSISDRHLKEWVKDHREDAYTWWKAWAADVSGDERVRGWVQSKVWMAASVLIGTALVASAVGGGLAGANLWLSIITGLAGAGALAATPLMRRRTTEGRILHHRWGRFGAYLQDYSLMPERGPEYLALWGAWLVYAIPLGVADTVMRNLDAKLSLAEMEQVAGGWYPVAVVGDHHRGFTEGLSALSTAVPASTIASSPSSSTGSGGGFSGGDGGGGGGSGGGSF